MADNNRLTTAALDEMDDTQLASELEKAKAELFNLRFSKALGQLEDHGRFKAVRGNIARIYTVARERELGIRTAPGSEE
ncbi:50S ribosomal protein L29 [Gleimia hominis]|uniref:Large ribosomal subunit protein uL29 n=1 Tax=Gleimia hominis TaxID=595468 RepID=A0ABU3I9U6_9ACTO|nr:50S ribosomal protein L29 [Gleimia hominis]MDT3767147.1 50S ribosomal protein L29 [Gleimia hominis]WIK64586.1 50S ribosomal protein L29 [Gleimia hominis]